MNLAQKAFLELFPEKNAEDYDFVLAYTGHFKPYNANVKYSRLFLNKKVYFNLSSKWKTVSEEIQIGLLQELMLKVFRKKKSTTNIDLYNLFLKEVHVSVPKTRVDSMLEESFNRVNEKYFYGMIEMPNLVWGAYSVRKLGSYEYGSDTIKISRVFYPNHELIDYIMYHEMLHKKHKFKNKNGRNYHHTNQFRKEEKVFENALIMEKQIACLAKPRRPKRIFRWL